MKLNLTKEWLAKRAERDDRAEVSAGLLNLNRLKAERPAENMTSINAAIEPENPTQLSVG